MTIMTTKKGLRRPKKLYFISGTAKAVPLFLPIYKTTSSITLIASGIVTLEIRVLRKRILLAIV